MPRARRPPRPVVVAVAGLTLGVVACGGEDDGASAAERARLSDALGFLVADFGLTEDQVSCTGRTIEERLDGVDLDAFVDDLRRVEAGTVAIDDLPPEESTLLTGAIAECVASS